MCGETGIWKGGRACGDRARRPGPPFPPQSPQSAAAAAPHTKVPGHPKMLLPRERAEQRLSGVAFVSAPVFFRSLPLGVGLRASLTTESSPQTNFLAGSPAKNTLRAAPPEIQPCERGHRARAKCLPSPGATAWKQQLSRSRFVSKITNCPLQVSCHRDSWWPEGPPELK